MLGISDNVLMLKRIFALALFILITWPFTALASGDHVVINSFLIQGTSPNDEYVELLNPTGTPVDLTGWRLSRKSASGTNTNLLTTFPEKVLLPGQKITIGHASSVLKTDLTYSTSGFLAINNTIILYSDAGKTVVDKVGMGSAGDFEGAAIPNPEAGEIPSRVEGEDTGNNLADFIFAEKEEEVPEETTESEPDPTTTTTITASFFFDLSVTELMPNPVGADGENEWIELKNNGSRADLGGLVLRDKIGSPHEYKIPLGTFLDPGDYLVLSAKATKISLNNTGDIIEIVSPFGQLIDSTEVNYGKAPEGSSFALFESVWSWTTQPSPGSQNIKKALVVTKTTKATTKSKKTTTTKKKKTKTGGDVLGETTEVEDIYVADEVPDREDKENRASSVMIGLAILGACLYTLYENQERREKVGKLFRTRYEEIRNRIREKVPRR